ncbi:MAG: lipopolysaccharide transport periplasmic protein LptA [Epsilonproteobacteria bacterium]|nr:lipopolysaccharide transport periplasmic protein LptA [Campylobacterota bacterium]
MRLLLVLICGLLFAQEIKVKSNELFYDSKKGISIFKGDVDIKRDNEEIKAKEMVLYFKDKKPVKFKATGNVKFKLKLDNNAIYQGRAGVLVYDLKSGDIWLKKDVFIKNLATNESIKAQEIKLNRFSKDLKIKGQPLNIIIKVSE